MKINRFCRDAFFRIEQVSSRKAKEEIIKGLMEDTSEEAGVFRSLVALALSPLHRFNTQVIPEVNHPASSTLGFGEIINKIKALGTIRGGDNDQAVFDIFSQLSEDDADVIKRVILKNLRIGATATTFNKFRPGLIYQHPYMRCSSFDKAFFGKHINLPCFSQLKADGRYTDVGVDSDGKVRYQARSGLIMNVPESFNMTPKFASCPGFVFMGEMIALDENGQEYPRELSNGKLNSDANVEEFAEQNRIRMFLWDMIPLGDWLDGESTKPYSERFKDLQAAVDGFNDPNIQVVDTVRCDDINNVIDHFTSLVSKGLEGTVVKDMDLAWKSGTAKKQMKVKVEFQIELKILEAVEGRGKHAGRLGSLRCESEDGLLKVGVGGGYTDKLRDELWAIRDSLPGRIITVEANGIMPPTDGNDSYSLFLPRFISGRDDKSESDDLVRIQEQFTAFTESFAVAQKG